MIDDSARFQRARKQPNPPSRPAWPSPSRTLSPCRRCPANLGFNTAMTLPMSDILWRRSLHRGGDRSIDLGLATAPAACTLQDADLEFFAVGEILRAAFSNCAIDSRRCLNIFSITPTTSASRQLDALVDFAAASSPAAAGGSRQARRILGAHRGLHVVVDAGFQGHDGLRVK